MRKKTTKYLTNAAMVAALYVVLTLVSQILGLASGQIQIRLSEALTILPVFLPEAVPGLAVGCLLANLTIGAALPDVIFGTLATLIGAFGTKLLSKKSKYIFVIPPIAANVIIIPLVLYFAYGIKPLWLSFITITAGEVISAGVLGILLYNLLSKHRDQFFPH